MALPEPKRRKRNVRRGAAHFFDCHRERCCFNRVSPPSGTSALLSSCFASATPQAGQVVERVGGRALVGGDEAPPVDAEHRGARGSRGVMESGACSSDATSSPLDGIQSNAIVRRPELFHLVHGRAFWWDVRRLDFHTVVDGSRTTPTNFMRDMLRRRRTTRLPEAPLRRARARAARLLRRE